MYYAFVVIGAHDGHKLEAAIRKSAQTGRVALVEPMPDLFRALQARFSSVENVDLYNFAVSDRTGTASLHHVDEGALARMPDFANQLASFDPNHLLGHLPNASSVMVKTEVETVSIRDFIGLLKATRISQLNIDTEGHDYTILRAFPFHEFRPDRVFFEHKHMDGVSLVGAKFSEILLRLVGYDYRCKIFDEENTVAFSAEWLTNYQSEVAKRQNATSE